MAEETKNTTNNATENVQSENQNPSENTASMQQEEAKDNSQTVEELTKQLVEAKAELQKFQHKYNQASTEAAESKKALRAKQTAEEREAEEIAERQRIADEENKAIKAELNHMKAVAAYKKLDEKTVELLIGAVSDGDHQAINTIIDGLIDKEVKNAVKEAEAKFLAERPQPQVGTGEYSGMTKEQIMAIPDRIARRQAMAENIHLFQ